MRRSRIALAGLISIVLGGGLLIAGCSSDDSSSGDEQSTTTAAPATAGTSGSDASSQGASANSGQGSADSSTASQSGRYVDYSPELVESTPGDKLLFFHADWCSQCQALEEDIEASGVPDGVTIFKVDYDSNQDLRQEYGVTIQTTVVSVDDNGEMIDSYVAYEEPTLDNVTSALIQ
jgi:thiol-disulfide isomerase/thioredoxin